MQIILLLFQVITAIPKIWDMISSLRKEIDRQAEEREQENHEEALKKLQEAKKAKDIENAAQNYLNS